ncbi:serine hydrolase domain-containing protein [Tellurirhabdus bombi]|uniref:serine hydrolase domain-containing protein n=1 Tax=Tellurirhabdus bombi TaxID=2907205 RepID=UPI001F1AD50F|nr:serine hydrolase domain-containing protein [Tellurirhabdus bombi]
MHKFVPTLYFSLLTGFVFAQTRPAPASQVTVSKPAVAPAAAPAARGTLVEAPPQTVGFSPDRLQRIDRFLQEYADRKQIPGAVALIARRGQIVYYKGIGLDDAQANKPLKRDAIFRIASQTKAITSVAIMMLYEEGKLLLDDPISRYIPEFRTTKVLGRFNPKDTTFTTVPAKAQISIRHLLTHTSGIGYPIPGIGSREALSIYAKYRVPNGIGTPNANMAGVVKTLAQLPLLHQPGERFTYGLSTDVLGYLVEIISGQKLDQFLQSRLFEPLGMKDTYFYLPADKAERLTVLHTEDSTRAYRRMPVRGGSNPDYYKSTGTFLSGGSGLCSTAFDYAIFLQMLLNGGNYNGKQILSPSSVRMMTSNQIGGISLANYKFGLGFSLATELSAILQPASVGTFGWSGILGTNYWADPKEELVILLMTQKYPNSFSDIDEKFQSLVYQALIDPTSPPFQANR